VGATQQRVADEARFREIFSNLGLVVAYARRRGSSDPEAIAAEAMTIAWRRLDVVPINDPRPWLYATARNLVLAEARRAREKTSLEPPPQPAPEPAELDPALATALRELAPLDREALLLIAWEDLAPKQAAAAAGIKPTAFRVRLWRARRRLQARLSNADKQRLLKHPPNLEKELT
jgi:RNA polymerase sigma factor (sigma-70 family)